MNDANRFFKYLNRINSVLFFIFIVFLSKHLKEARWLFPHQDFAITAVDQIREKEGPEEKQSGPTQAIYYEIVRPDSNGDGKFSAEGHAAAAFSKADGSGYVEVVSDARRIIGHQVRNQGAEVAVLFERDAKVLYQSFSSEDFSKTCEVLVIEVPGRP